MEILCEVVALPYDLVASQHTMQPVQAGPHVQNQGNRGHACAARRFPAMRVRAQRMSWRITDLVGSWRRTTRSGSYGRIAIRRGSVCRWRTRYVHAARFAVVVRVSESCNEVLAWGAPPRLISSFCTGLSLGRSRGVELNITNIHTITESGLLIRDMYR